MILISSALMFLSGPPGLTRDQLPEKIRKQLPERALWAGGGGIVSTPWTTVVDLDKKTLTADSGSVTLPPTLVDELGKLAEAAFREKLPLPAHPTADYHETLIMVDGPNVLRREGYGPFPKGAHKNLLDRLHALSPKGRFATVTLRDVQGLFGGRDLDLQADGSVTLRSIKPPQRERTVRAKTDLAVVAELNALIQEHDFFSLQTKARAGVPDEARPTIQVTLPSGAYREVAKWANDRHPGFDAIYGRLLSLAKALGD